MSMKTMARILTHHPDDFFIKINGQAHEQL